MIANLTRRALAVALLATTAGAMAQTFPAKPVRWIVPYAAGGGSDFLARTIGQTWSTQVGQPVLVDNKPGGNTALGAAETARAAPDGYTVMSADNGTMVFNPALYKNLSYSPTRDLAPVTLMG
ncbi:tripartite tricarboxylate transporter substrate-binding protein, partial [uncultured Xylophilus sp.]|uniref:Bug family tripartite tricarboxylate transporter substrate binding protein n=1 Tax=uncultured Xylophilus sp. TaxID=296832 RepID=UPI0025FD60E4